MRSVGMDVTQLNGLMSENILRINIQRMLFLHVFSVVVEHDMALISVVNTVEVHVCKGKDQIQYSMNWFSRRKE